MKRIFLYSIIHVAFPIHLTLPPRDPGIGSPDIFGSVEVDPLKVGNLSAGKLSVFDISNNARKSLVVKSVVSGRDEVSRVDVAFASSDVTFRGITRIRDQLQLVKLTLVRRCLRLRQLPGAVPIPRGPASGLEGPATLNTSPDDRISTVIALT